MTSPARPARAEEIERARSTIDAELPVTGRVVAQPNVFEAAEHGEELFMWVYEAAPESFQAGAIYGTVFLRFTPGKKPYAAQFRSRRRPDGGDDTVY